jgi:hypothetical protein
VNYKVNLFTYGAVLGKKKTAKRGVSIVQEKANESKIL